MSTQKKCVQKGSHWVLWHYLTETEEGMTDRKYHLQDLVTPGRLLHREKAKLPHHIFLEKDPIFLFYLYRAYSLLVEKNKLDVVWMKAKRSALRIGNHHPAAARHWRIKTVTQGWTASISNAIYHVMSCHVMSCGGPEALLVSPILPSNPFHDITWKRTENKRKRKRKR